MKYATTLTRGRTARATILGAVRRESGAVRTDVFSMMMVDGRFVDTASGGVDATGAAAVIAGSFNRPHACTGD